MKKILLVDDKATIGRVLKIYLGTEYDLEYFESPLKALEWLNEGNVPDLIISDIHMPHMRGNEFLYYLKGNELFKHIPVMISPVRKVPSNASSCSKPERQITYSSHSTRWNSGHASRNTSEKELKGRYAILYLHRKQPDCHRPPEQGYQWHVRYCLRCP